MSERKNLDRLFQEKFKDFEAEPNDQVWKNIEAALQQKKKRKVVPIWWKLSGVAAIFLIGGFVINSFFDNTDKNQNPIVIDTNSDGIRSGNTNEAVASDDSSGIKNNTSTVTESSYERNPTIGKTNTSTTEQSNVNGNPEVENNAVATSETNTSKTKKQKTNVYQNTSIANGTNLKGKKAKQNSEAFTNRNNPAASISKNQKKENISDAIVNKSLKKSEIGNQKSENASMVVTNSDFKKSQIPSNTIANEVSKEIRNQKSEITTVSDNNKLDSTAIATVVPNALEELLKNNEKEKKMIAETNVNRWQLTSSVAPIYLSSTSNGSPIDAQFAENEKSYENNLSFGLGVNYAVNKKISIRTGINKLTLGYNTNDVAFFAGLESQNIGNISKSSNGNNIEIVNRGVASDGLLPFETSLQNVNEGSINQQMGYIEMPLEMSYKLIDKKFGMTLIGGMSTLFLNENTIAVTSPGLSASLGRATNLNDVHFSSNIGVGFKYSFLKAFEVNFEPMFKYQINTFSKESGNFKPYFIGLYSGVSFSF